MAVMRTRKGASLRREGHKSVVQAFYDQWNSGTIDFERLIDRDIANHQPDRAPERGLDTFRKAIGGVMRAVPDSDWTTLRLVEEDDFVVCHNRWSGTYRGHVFRGVPTPDGFRFSTEHVHIYRVAGNRIAEHWVVRDDLGDAAPDRRDRCE